MDPICAKDLARLGIFRDDSKELPRILAKFSYFTNQKLPCGPFSVAL